MIYATRERAKEISAMLNTRQGFAQSYVYRCKNGWTVVSTWNSSASYRGLTLDEESTQ